MPVPLRDVWSDESDCFTIWLARPENLERLGDPPGMQLEPEKKQLLRLIEFGQSLPERCRAKLFP